VGLGNPRFSSIAQSGPFIARKRLDGQQQGFGMKDAAEITGTSYESKSSESIEQFHILTIGHTINMIEYIESSKVVCTIYEI
jgi:hypothetical protein